MAEFKMPSLGADMASGKLLEWNVKPGDRVKRGQVVAVVGTEKGDIEVEVFEDGVIGERLFAIGAEVPVGAVLAYVGGEEVVAKAGKGSRQSSRGGRHGRACRRAAAPGRGSRTRTAGRQRPPHTHLTAGAQAG